MQDRISRGVRLSAPVQAGTRRCTGPPRIIGKKESSSKQEYSKKWNRVLLKEAKSSSEEFRLRISSSDDRYLKR